MSVPSTGASADAQLSNDPAATVPPPGVFTPPLSAADPMEAAAIKSRVSATAYGSPPGPVAQLSTAALMTRLVLLALPVMGEAVLNTLVGLNDTYLANHVVEPSRAADAGAAVGAVMYLFWFVGLFASVIGTGATAVISRAVGAQHRLKASAAAGQAITLGLVSGIVLSIGMLLFSGQAVELTGLKPSATGIARSYLLWIAPGVPFVVILAVANASLRGAGDTIRPALSMAVVGITTITLTRAFSTGWGPFPRLGTDGLAIGTSIAYIVGATMQLCILFKGYGKLRLRLHRLKPHLRHLSAIVKVGLPVAAESGIMFAANFAVIRWVNSLGSVAGAAHANTVRIEAISYMTGFAIAIAVSALVGQSLGAKNPVQARRVAHLGFALGGGVMSILGLAFILFGTFFSGQIAEDPAVIQSTALCLFVTGFIQPAFAASIVYSGALRGAGDTFTVMAITLSTILGIRLVGSWLVVKHWGMGIGAVWVVLCVDICLRGIFMFCRFHYGRWERIKL